MIMKNLTVLFLGHPCPYLAAAPANSKLPTTMIAPPGAYHLHFAFPNESKRDWVRKYIRPFAMAGVAKVFSLRSTLPSS